MKMRLWKVSLIHAFLCVQILEKFDLHDKWYENIPSHTYFIIQGNNDFAEPDHVRACSSLEEFNAINLVSNTLHTDELEYQGPWDDVENKATYFKRFMTIGFKG